MMLKPVFHFSDYRSFLIAQMGQEGRRTGRRQALAQALASPPSHISQVLRGTTHLTLEQAERATLFLGLTGDEAHYFLLLVHRDRSGTKGLQDYYQRQIDEIQRKYLTIAERIQVQSQLPDDVKVTYYSSWLYLAVHLALTIPTLKSKEQIASRLKVPIEKVSQVIQFLADNKLIQPSEAGWVAGPFTTFLDKKSPLIVNHHMNWRTKALESLHLEKDEHVHYSGAYSISREAALLLKDKCLDMIKEMQPIIRDAPEEDVYVLTIDFFSL